MTKVKRISLKKYNAIMDRICRQKLPVQDLLIKMLDEAAKYDIAEFHTKGVKRSK